MARKTKEMMQKETVQKITEDETLDQAASDVLAMHDSATEYHAEAYASSRCGGALRVSREAQGLSVLEIATRLRLSAKQIEAIEADNFAALPEPTIVRGFIRNYAKQLKIDAEPLLNAYSAIVPSVQPHEMIVKPSANMKMTSYQKPKTGLYSLAALAILLGVGIWLFYQQYVQKPSPVTPTASIGSTESLPQAALPVAERASASEASTALELPPAADTNTTTAPIADSTVSAPPFAAVTPPVEPAPAAPVEAAPVAPVAAESAPVGMAKLEFSATQETWVNVLDASGREVYSQTIFAGSRETVNVRLPANITVGNAGATGLSMNGKAYDLAPYSRNNVAHITLDK